MRALVAESSVTTRVMLKNLLVRFGFQVEEVSDELGAACLAHQPDAPELALLSLDTVLVDFALTCEAMRQAKPDVYVVALVPPPRQNELMRILLDGADDFIVKSGSLQEMEARLHIIQQHLEHPRATRPPAEPRPEAAPEASLDHLLAEAFRGTLPPAASPGGPAATDGASFHEADLPGLVGSVFQQLGLEAPALTRALRAAEDPAYVLQTFFIAQEEDVARWLDVRLELDAAPAARLVEHLTGRTPPSEVAFLQALQDQAALIQDVLRRQFAPGHDSAEPCIFTPIPPMAMRYAQLPRGSASTSMLREHVGLAWRESDVRLLLTTTLQSAPERRCTVAQLRQMDVLAAPIRTDDLELLRAGVMLDSSYISKIQTLVHTHGGDIDVRVLRPPESMQKAIDALRNVALPSRAA